MDIHIDKVTTSTYRGQKCSYSREDNFNIVDITFNTSFFFNSQTLKYRNLIEINVFAIYNIFILILCVTLLPFHSLYNYLQVKKENALPNFI